MRFADPESQRILITLVTSNLLHFEKWWLRKYCLTLGFLVQVKSVSSLMQVPLPAIILWLLIDHLSFFTTGKLW
jgi:hypothetical protein